MPSEIRSFLGLAGDVRTLMMDEAHASRYMVHSGADKTYYDLRDMYGGHVMADSVIPISSDSTEESVCSHVPRSAPEVGAVFVTSPARVLDLVDYSSSSYSDPSVDSLALAPELPLVLPFLYSDDSEADSEFEHAEQRPERHESLAVHDARVSRWRDMITSRPSSPSGSLSHDTLASPSKKRVRPFPARRLAWRRVSHCSSDRHSLPDFTSDSSSSGSSSDSSLDTSSGLPSDSLSDTSSVHSSGFDASDSSSERSLDSSLLFDGPSRKRCRSPTTLVPLSTPVLRSIAPTHADILPPRKRFRDSYSPEDSREEHVEIDTANVEVVADLEDVRGVRQRYSAGGHVGDCYDSMISSLTWTEVHLDRILSLRLPGDSWRLVSLMDKAKESCLLDRLRS
ncbi:hypothetical protein Tco_0542883 [Tanacetum coccineum]